jgi:arginine-tRNA-protein transferase
LAHGGFRRSHNIAYRPACQGCRACMPIRVRANDFIASRGQRRVLSRNDDLRSDVRPAEATQEQYRLFRTYVEARHGDGDMAAMRYADFRAMIEDSAVDTALIEYREPGGRLVAAIIADRLSDGWSAVYSMFEASLDRRSLGRFMVLDLIRRARDEGLPYTYLGYWIERSRKMAYKIDFQPCELLGPAGWRIRRIAPG